MAERESSWNIDAVSQSLQTQSEVGKHVIFGYGYRWEFASASGSPSLLDFYPEHLLARFRGGSLKLDLARVVQIRPEEQGIRIEAADDVSQTSLFIGSRGEIALGVVPQGSEVTQAPPVTHQQAEPTPVELPAPIPSVEAASPDVAVEKKPYLTLPGRLMSKPVEGRLDSKGKPTAWARFAAHLESQETAAMYLATFHRHTRRIALSLSQGDNLTVQGYPRKSSRQDRMDTLSVFQILHHAATNRNSSDLDDSQS